MNFSYEQLKKITGAKVILEKNTAEKFEISTDTRTLKKGDFYLPLSGENFDGETFISNAIKKGALGYFTTKENNVHNDADFALYVDDTKTAYLKLALAYKNTVNPKTIAITGSSGKTTTKEIFNAIFSANRRTHKSQLNHNNEIGLCQTLLSMPKDTEFLIVEMGMRGLNEIELLSKYSEPDFAVITNIGTAHIGRLGSRENIAKAKCEIVNHLKEDGVLITLPDELYGTALRGFSGIHITINPNDGTFKTISMSTQKSVFEYKSNQYTLNVGGEYNVFDALLAIETALLCGLTPHEIQNGLELYAPIEKRFEETEIQGLKIINDSYNANPDSMKAAIKAFVELYEGEKVLVLADMKELGQNEIQYHQELGEFLNSLDNFTVFTVGELAKNISESTIHKSKHFCSNIEVAKKLKTLNRDTNVLLKGSRSMKLEEIIEEMKK